MISRLFPIPFFAAALTVLSAFCALTVDAQNVYRWVDKDGKVFYSDQPPPPDAKSAQQKRLGSGTTVDREQVPYAVQVATQKNPVSMFATDCGELCNDAKALLAKRGVPYTLRNPQANSEDAGALRKLVGSMDVPVLVVGDTPTKGFDEATWNAALDAGGYPRVNPFTKAPPPKLTPPLKAPAPPPAPGAPPKPGDAPAPPADATPPPTRQ